MRFLLLNQTFHPDLSATGQYLSDLALGLVQRGHQVTVIAARRAYDAPQIKYPRKELWQTIRVVRVASTWFGKRTKFGRAIDALSFLCSCAVRLLMSARPDVVVVLTSPPLISFLAACFASVRRCRLCYWVMDFNPDEAIAARWLRADSVAAKVLNWISLFSLRRSTMIIALDRFMRDRIIARGGPPQNIAVLPLWSRDNHIHFDPAGRQRFRAEHGLDQRFVVMYSGNHSPCHPLDSLVAAAESLATEPDISFCFVGGGTEWHRLRRSSANLTFLPYQPLNGLSASLSAADLHVMVMGDRFVGLVHPCKLYNLLRIGAPLLYIGPAHSHITDLFDMTPQNGRRLLTARHGEVQKIVQQIKKVCAEARIADRPEPFRHRCSQANIVDQLVALVESL